MYCGFLWLPRPCWFLRHCTVFFHAVYGASNLVPGGSARFSSRRVGQSIGERLYSPRYRVISSPICSSATSTGASKELVEEWNAMKIFCSGSGNAIWHSESSCLKKWISHHKMHRDAYWAKPRCELICNSAVSLLRTVSDPQPCQQTDALRPRADSWILSAHISWDNIESTSNILTEE